MVYQFYMKQTDNSQRWLVLKDWELIFMCVCTNIQYYKYILRWLQTINENFSHAQNSICNIDIPNIMLVLSFLWQYNMFMLKLSRHYLVLMHRKVYTVEFVSLWHLALCGYVNFINLFFKLNINLILVFSFLQYCYLIVRSVFVIKIISYPVAKHEHTT
jgi:hypothetical protein